MREAKPVSDISKRRRTVDADKVEGIREIEVAPEATTQEPEILEDICVEELAIDGICGVY